MKSSSTDNNFLTTKSSLFNQTSSINSLFKAKIFSSQYSIFHQGKSYSQVNGHLHFFITTILSLNFNSA
jgi:hypothetical protein